MNQTTHFDNDSPAALEELIKRAMQNGEPWELDTGWEGGEEEYGDEHVMVGLTRCIEGTMASVGPFFARSLAAALLQFVLAAFIANRGVVHLLETLVGLSLLCSNMDSPRLAVPLLLYVACTCALVNANLRVHKGLFCTIFTIAYILACQMAMESADFMAIRGGWMIAAMKQISLCMDLASRGVEEAQLPGPTLLAQLAYVFNPSTLLLGPFITFDQFQQMQEHAAAVSRQPRALFIHFLHVCHHLGLAFLFLLLSTCLLDARQSPLFPRHFPLPLVLLHDLDAFSFRCSHFFVSHFATATALLGGHPKGLEIVRVRAIEWPKSLAAVATGWNVPMHTFLHKYVYTRTVGQIGVFASFLLTFALSAALHGMDIQMVAVLLSLGLFAFLERRLRDRLASRLSTCIRVKKCPIDGCQHQRKKDHPLTRCLLFVFLFCNILYLNYLGAPFYGDGQFQGYSAGHLWNIWAGEMQLIGHWLGLAMFLLAAVIPVPAEEQPRRAHVE